MRRWEWHQALAAGFACPREWKARLTSREWEEVQALARLEYIGPDRADVGRQKAALGMMSTMAKLDDFDASCLLPNQPPKRELTLEEQAEQFEKFAARWNARWQPNQSER